MNFNSTIKTGGRFSIGVVNPDNGEYIPSTPWVSNQLLNGAETYLYQGFPVEGKVFSIGSDSSPTNPTNTTVNTPLSMELISETVASDCSVSFVRAADNVEEIHVVGESIFQVRVMEDGVINELAINNFCRALVIDVTSGLSGLPVVSGMVLDIMYEFTLVYRVTRHNALTLDGSAGTTDSIDHFVDSSLAFIAAPARQRYPAEHQWDALLSDNINFQIAENIYGIDNVFDSSVALTADTVTNNITERAGTFLDPAATLPAIRSFYFGNQSFGINYILVDTNTYNSIGLVLDSGDQLTFTTTFTIA